MLYYYTIFYCIVLCYSLFSWGVLSNCVLDSTYFYDGWLQSVFLYSIVSYCLVLYCIELYCGLLYYCILFYCYMLSVIMFVLYWVLLDWLTLAMSYFVFCWGVIWIGLYCMIWYFIFVLSNNVLMIMLVCMVIHSITFSHWLDVLLFYYCNLPVLYCYILFFVVALLVW